MSDRRTALLAALVCLCAAAFGVATIEISGDPAVYHQRMLGTRQGIPYVSAEVEHLPGALIPMLIAFAIAGSDVGFFASTFVGLMSLSTIGTVVLGVRVGDRLGVEAPLRRWVVAAAPLAPLVLFRVEPWVVFLVVLAVYLWTADRWASGTVAATLAGLAKGWPVVLGLAAWKRGRRVAAVAVVATTAAVVLALLATPGFRTGRAFDGIHSETLTGAAWSLWTLMSGQSIEYIVAAGAVYVPAPSWMLPVQLVLGTAILGAAVAKVRGHVLPWPAVLDLCGLGVVAVLVASPLFSTQFAFWLVPFAAWSRSRAVQATNFLVQLLSLAIAITWVPWVRELDPRWFALVTVRNVVLLLLGVAFLGSLRAARETSPVH